MPGGDLTTMIRQGAPVYVLSCGQGINGEQMIRSVLVQFPAVRSRVVRVPHMHGPQQIHEILEKVREEEGVVAYTIVDPELRMLVQSECEKTGILCVDFMGPALDMLEAAFHEKPLGEPGRYRKFNQINMDRVAAIEFAVAHDDGLNPQDLGKAEIVLVGLSRSGKTPLSMYLSVHGWKVANVPIVIGIPLPSELMAINRKRIVALYIDPEQLAAHRQIRRKRLGLTDDMAYTGKKEVFREVESVRELYRRHGFATINVSNKPIESSAEEVVSIIEKRFPEGAHKQGKRKVAP
ncbi:kinase/pyrophosphorylase [Desulfobotulus sp. H1]|uniref:Kinase/pyrophosphorylase n=1 Tax=Desulfobotulus pelophilus TaxID=2823377 RepID=A0ABT3NBD8_9BACT|nr:pyruvate, water dikinase regulatory protein [Desulfobotulus pelophilus]MCW7754486.1 kinase/pyrophosphorylase [Desulfobotulus pelophilus]